MLIIILISIYLIINSFIAGTVYQGDCDDPVIMSRRVTVFFILVFLLFGIIIIITDKIRS